MINVGRRWTWSAASPFDGFTDEWVDVEMFRTPHGARGHRPVCALMNELHHVLDVQIEPDDRIQRETMALYGELTSPERRRASIYPTNKRVTIGTTIVG